MVYKLAIEVGLGVDVLDGLEMEWWLNDGVLIVVVVDNGFLMVDFFDRIIFWIVVIFVVFWYLRVIFRWVLSSLLGFILW